MYQDLLQIEREIVNAVEKASSKCRKPENVSSNEFWTKEIKKELHCLGKRHGLITWGGEKHSEWLWDICWADYEGEGRWDQGSYRTFKGVRMACEIEWNYGNQITNVELINDFLKLTVADVDYRVFIFAVHPKQKIDEIFNLLYSMCPPSKGYRYLAIGIYDVKKDNVCRAWTV